MYRGIEFFTATCLKWQNLLEQNKHKEIVMGSLKFLVDQKRIWLYGYVIMPNHIHFLWRRQDEWQEKSIEQQFLKFTAQQIKFNIIANHPYILENYKSTQADREYHFWERRPYIATMNYRLVTEQKLDYIHHNPVRKNICNFPEEYKWSSAGFYFNGNNELNLLTHYMEHI
jgi:REP element-mobilizing transposase RayT